MKDAVQCCQLAGVQPPASAWQCVGSVANGMPASRLARSPSVVEESNSCDEEDPGSLGDPAADCDHLLRSPGTRSNFSHSGDNSSANAVEQETLEVLNFSSPTEFLIF